MKSSYFTELPNYNPIYALWWKFVPSLFASIIRNSSINRGKCLCIWTHWIPAFAGMTGAYLISWFPRKRESMSVTPIYWAVTDWLNWVVSLCRPLPAIASSGKAGGSQRQRENHLSLRSLRLVNTGFSILPREMLFLFYFTGVSSKVTETCSGA